MLDRRGLTLSMELRRYRQKGILTEKISKTAYLNQRKKLSPLAFLDMCQYRNRRLYDAGEMKSYKGYLLLAADGSSINIPTTNETLELYGNASHKDKKPQASLGLSCLYDCINKTILTGSINRARFSEPAQLENHLAELPSLVGDKPSIVMLDRGYPSTALFMRLNAKDQKYVIRLRSVDFKQEKSVMKSNDETVEITFTKSRLNHYKGTDIYDQMIASGHLKLRIVKLALPCGGTEYLATNLRQEEFDTEEVSKLYTYRWGVETAFDTLKNKLNMENFTGTSPIMIEQDIFASIYVCNLASDMIADAEVKLQQREANRQSKRKHRMAINRSFAIGILKDLLVAAITAESKKKRERLFQQMIDETLDEVLPVRPGRRFKRSNGLLSARFANSRKPTF